MILQVWVCLLASVVPWWSHVQDEQYATTEELVEIALEDEDKFLEFATDQETEDFRELVELYQASQPLTYSGILDRIRERRKNRTPEQEEQAQGETKKQKKRLLDRLKENKEAKAEVQRAKADKWKGLGWALGGGALFLIALMMLVGKFMNLGSK